MKTSQLEATNGIYINGDWAVFTGETKVIHGGLFYVYQMAEGCRQGNTAVSQREPVSHY